MNKKMLDTRIRSIEHYDKEAAQFKEAYETTKSTRDDIIKSLVEFSPLEVNNLVLYGHSMIFKVTEIVGVDRNNEDYRLEIKVKYPIVENGYHGSQTQKWSSPQSMKIPFKNFPDLKILSESI